MAGLTLFCVSALFFYDLFGGRYLLTERDLGPYFIPPRFFWVESIKHGDFPLWNPYQFSGHPFFANPQHAVLYPLNGLFFFLPFDIAFNGIIVLHFFLGGLFVYLFLRELKAGVTGALISGLTFMLGGYLLSVHSLLTILLSVIWTPLIMLFFRRALKDPGLKNEILTALFITLSFLAGGIEIVYGNFLILLFMAIFSLSHGFSGIEWRKELRGSLSLLIVSVFFFILSAVQLIPFMELYLHSIRSGGISYQEATVWSFAPKDSLLFFIPDAYGYFYDMKKYWVTQCWLKTLYTGGLPFILTGIFFFPFKKRSSLRHDFEGFATNPKFYLFLALFSFFLSLGQHNPLYRYVYEYLPFFNGIRYPVKFLYIFILVLSITAGLGFEKVAAFSKDIEGKRLKHLLIILSLLCGVALLYLVLDHPHLYRFLKERGVDVPHFNFLSVNLYNAKRVLFYLSLFFLLLRIGYQIQWKSWARILLVFFLAADLFGNMGFFGREETSEYFRKTRIQEIISADRNQEDFRISSTPKTSGMETPILVGEPTRLGVLKEKHIASMNQTYRLHDIWGVEVIRLKRVDELYRFFAGTPSVSATRLPDLYGLKYVVSVTPFEEDDRFELVYSKLEGLQGKKEDLLKLNTIKLYRYRDHLPRGWLVNKFTVLKSDDLRWKLGEKEFQPREEVLLEETPVQSSGSAFTITPGRKSGSVKLLSQSNNRLQFVVEAKGDSILVVRDTCFPGWKAYVDGEGRRIYNANYSFRALPMNAGTHRVEFIYDPLSFKIGAAITMLGIVGCVVICLKRRRPTNKKVEVEVQAET